MVVAVADVVVVVAAAVVRPKTKITTKAVVCRLLFDELLQYEDDEDGWCLSLALAEAWLGS